MEKIIKEYRQFLANNDLFDREKLGFLLFEEINNEHKNKANVAIRKWVVERAAAWDLDLNINLETGGGYSGYSDYLALSLCQPGYDYNEDDDYKHIVFQVTKEEFRMSPEEFVPYYKNKVATNQIIERDIHRERMRKKYEELKLLFADEE